MQAGLAAALSSVLQRAANVTFAVLCGRTVILTFGVAATNRPRSHLSCSLASLQAARPDLNASQAASLLLPRDEIDEASRRGHSRS